MFYREQVLAALEAKRATLQAVNQAHQEQLAALRRAKERLGQMTCAEILEELREVPAPGARPTPEFDAEPTLRIPFPQRWQHLAEMRHWAAAVLAGVRVGAVDGSQLPLDKEAPLPVAAIQIGWFVNEHDVRGSYEKDVEVEILSPDEVSSGDLGEGNTDVAVRRYESEVHRVCALLERYRGSGGETLILFDGSLLVSFAGPRRETRDRYRAAAVRLLRTSEEAEVPLVGYIDRSYARDIATMLGYLAALPLGRKALVSDAVLLNDPDDTLWEPWRTPAFLCQRPDVVQGGNYVDPVTGRDYQNEIGFVYLKTNRHAPARLEFPAWLLRAGWLDRVVDWIRAEVCVGGGYPYALQAADAIAVIQSEDRARYLRALEEFCRVHKIPLLQPSAKQASKERRRA